MFETFKKILCCWVDEVQFQNSPNMMYFKSEILGGLLLPIESLRSLTVGSYKTKKQGKSA